MSCEVVEQFSDSTFSVRSCHVRVQSEPASRRKPCPNGWCVNRKLFFHCILVPSTNYPHISISNRQVPFLITSTYTKIVITYIPLNLPRYFKLKKNPVHNHSGMSNLISKKWVLTQVSVKVIPNQVFGWQLAENGVGSEPRFGTYLTLDHTSIGWLLNFDSIIKLVISNLPVDALCSDN